MTLPHRLNRGVRNTIKSYMTGTTEERTDAAVTLFLVAAALELENQRADPREHVVGIREAILDYMYEDEPDTTSQNSGAVILPFHRS